jgi:protoporphyrinogen oxidase
MPHDPFRQRGFFPPMEPQRTLAPPPAKPTLVTKNGKYVPIAEPFTVHISDSDPNSKQAGMCFEFRQPPPTASEIEKFAQEIINRNFGEAAREAIFAEVWKEYGEALAQQIRGRVMVLGMMGAKRSKPSLSRRGL